MVPRQLVPFRPHHPEAGGGGGKRDVRMPRPPPKPRSAALRPTPPSGPPPAHAIVLAKKPGIAGFDTQAIVRRAKPPPSTPQPPREPPPLSLAAGSSSSAALAQHHRFPADSPKHQLMQLSSKQVQEQMFARMRQDPRAAAVTGKSAHDEQAPVPVPDYIVSGWVYAVYSLLVCLLLASVYVITVYGTYLPPSAELATHAATFIGSVVNVGMFESVKCVVIACVALAQDESRKRDVELQARRIRMELKAQRVQTRGRRFVISA